MKKSLYLLFVILIVLSCFNLSGLAQEKTVVKWLQWKGNEIGFEKLLNIKEAFEKENPDITLEIVDSPFLGYYDKVISLHRARQTPDLIQMQFDWVWQFVNMGILENLDPFIEKEPSDFMDQYYATFHKRVNNGQYILPLNSGCVCLFYNTDLFREFGIPRPPQIWEELVEVALKATDPAKNKYVSPVPFRLNRL